MQTVETTTSSPNSTNTVLAAVTFEAVKMIAFRDRDIENEDFCYWKTFRNGEDGNK